MGEVEKVGGEVRASAQPGKGGKETGRRKWEGRENKGGGGVGETEERENNGVEGREREGGVGVVGGSTHLSASLSVTTVSLSLSSSPLHDLLSPPLS